jgi:carbon starvation protein
MIFILLMAIWASVWYVMDYVSRGQWILVAIQVAVMVSAVFIILESWAAVSKFRRGEEPESDSQSSISSPNE